MQREDNLITKGFEVYFTDGIQIFTYCDGKIKTVDSGVIANINTENTTISRVDIDQFMIYQLYDCYIKICKSLFNDISIRCKKSDNFDENTYKRDFLWMTINVLKYHIEFGNFGEAERILEEVNYCGGFCNGSNVCTMSANGCGCCK